jgi:imidazolonepropionase-like amidohydrolase
LENATVEVNNGKIVKVATNISASGGKAVVIDAKGKHVYPGLILPSSDLGLKEIGAGVRGSNDFQELGEYNSNIRAITAYNTDSRVINVLRSNGVLLASVVPEGGIISGSSSVVQLDAWNWEDAAYKMDAGIHLRMPSFINRFGRRWRRWWISLVSVGPR